jgi:hypothetical protein
MISTNLRPHTTIQCSGRRRGHFFQEFLPRIWLHFASCTCIQVPNLISLVHCVFINKVIVYHVTLVSFVASKCVALKYEFMNSKCSSIIASHISNIAPKSHSPRVGRSRVCHANILCRSSVLEQSASSRSLELKAQRLAPWCFTGPEYSRFPQIKG